VASKELSRGDEQGELALARRAEPNAVPVEMIRRQKTAAAAFSLACQSSGLEDKEIYSGLGIDPGYFSRIKKGEATLQADLVSVFCELVELQSEAERQLEIVREELAAEKLKVRVLKDAINGRAAA
jgi:hypothetical protein